MGIALKIKIDSSTISRVMSARCRSKCRLVIYLTDVLPRRLYVAVYPSTMDEQPLDADILDLATHKMCGTTCCHVIRWALTSPFHPYHICGGCFLSHYSTLADGFPLGNMMLCVARTFLPQHNYAASDKTCYCQIFFCKNSASRVQNRQAQLECYAEAQPIFADSSAKIMKNVQLWVLCLGVFCQYTIMTSKIAWNHSINH